MELNNFFGKKYSAIQVNSTYGTYPFTTDGIWHSGIHVVLGEKSNEPVFSPVNGTIVSYKIDFDNAESENFYLLKDDINLPTENGNIKVSCYSAITNLESLYRYKKYISQNNTIADLMNNCDDFEVVLNGKTEYKVPKGLQIFVKLDLNEVQYIELFGIKKFVNSTVYISFLKNYIGIIKDNKIQTVTNTYTIESEFRKYVLIEDIEINNVTVKAGIPITEAYKTTSDGNYEIKVKNDNNAYVISEKLTKQKGYIIVDNEQYTIGSLGNIRFHSDKDKYYYIESRKITNEIFNYFNLSKNELNKIEILINTLSEQAEKMRNSNYLINRNNRGIIVSFYELDINDSSRIKYQIIIDQIQKYRTIKECLELNEKHDIILISLNNTNNYPFRNNISLNGKYNYKYFCDNSSNGISSVLLKDGNTLDIYTVKNKNILFLTKDELNFTEKEFIDANITLGKKNAKTEISSLQYVSINSYVTGLKVIVNSKEITNNSKENNIGVFECRPFFFSGDYTFKITEEQIKKYLFSQVKIKRFTSGQKVIKKASYIYSSKEEAEKASKSEPVDYINYDTFLLNFSDILRKYKELQEKDIEEEYKQLSYAYCQIPEGYVPVRFSELEIIIDKEEQNRGLTEDEKRSLCGTSITKDTFIGRSKDNSVDWALFFTENIIRHIPDKYTLVLKNAKCKKITRDTKTFYFPNNSTFKEKENLDDNRFIEIEEVTVRVSFYSDENPNACEIDEKKNVVKLNNLLKRIYLNTTYFELKKDNETDEVKCTSIQKKEKHNTSDVKDEVLLEFINNIILIKLIESEYKYTKTKGFYNVFITLKPSDLISETGFNQKLIIRSDESIFKYKNEEVNFGTILTAYSAEKEEDTIVDEYKCESVIKKQLDKEFFYFTQNDIQYKITKEDANKNSTNILKEYFDSIATINFQNEHNNPKISTNETCPDNKLLCNLEKLKKDFIEYDGGKYKNYISKHKNELYAESNYSKFLEELLSKVICKHPLEQNEEKHKELCDCAPNYLDLKEFNKGKDADILEAIPENSSSDKKISTKDDKKIDKNKNSFYFLYPFSFYKTINDSGVREFNPYEEKSYSEINNFSTETLYIYESRTTTNTFYDLTQTVKTNPGFAPFLGKGNSQAIGGDGESAGYAKINGFFYQAYESYTNGFHYYPHEGLDFAGLQIARTEPKEKHPPIHSFINGVVVKLGDQQDAHYGLHMIVSDGINKLYLLGHLCGYADGITVGSLVTPGMIVGYVGNTGNCKSTTSKALGGGSHLHLSIYVTDEAKKIANADKKDKALDSVLWSKSESNYKWFNNGMLVNPFDNLGEKK